MKFLWIKLFLLSFFLISCGEKLISKQDILDLLEEDGGPPASSPASNTNNQINSSTTQSSGSTNLDYYGLTNSSTGTTTNGATGFPAGANPTGR